MKPDTPRKFFDVARPGRSAPSATSRPVVTKGSQQPDPMMHQQPAIQLTAHPETLPADTPADPIIPATAEAPSVPDVEAPPVGQTPSPAADILVVSAQNFKPPKPSKNHGRHLVIAGLILIVIAVAAVAVYPLIRSKL